MPNDDEKNPRDNVSPKLKPKEAKSENTAPAGHLGIATQGIDLGLGNNTRIVRMTVDVAVQENEPDLAPELSPEEQRAAYLESLPRLWTH